MKRGTEQRQNKPKGWVISGGEYGRRTPGNEERIQSLTHEEVPFSLPAVPQTVYKRMVDLSLWTRKQKLGSGSLRIKAAKKSGFTLLCRKEAVAPPLSTGCLPGNPSTKEHTGHAGEISLAGPRITLLIATFPGISWLKQREGSESGKAGQLDKKGAFSACGLVLPRILSRALCIPGC